MRTRVLPWPVLATGMLIGAGCQHSQSLLTKITPVPPAQPFVFYDKTGDPSQSNPVLSERELQKIIAWVATQTSDPVWLVWVSSFANGTYFSVAAYLIPDETTPRIRIGRAYNVPTSKRQTGICSPWIYAQTSIPGQTFSERLTKPSIMEMPFSFPVAIDRDSKQSSSMSKEEVVAITDFVRQPSSYEGAIAHQGPSREEVVQQILQSSICHAWRMGDEINVSFGHTPDSLRGDWLIVTLKRTPTGYRIVNWGKLIS